MFLSDRLISIIIPTFNERDNIVDLIKAINSFLTNYNYEIIIVDDNSFDGTSKVVKKFFRKDRRIKLFIRKNKRDLGTAILYGINKSKGQVIIGMDADFNHPPKKIPELISALKDSDLVVASRFVYKGGMENKIRYFFTYIFNLFLKYFLGFPIMDNMSGFYAIKRDKLILFPLKKIYYGYGEYHLRLVYFSKSFGLGIKEIPVYYQRRRYGKSKSNLLKMFFKYLIIAIRLRFN